MPPTDSDLLGPFIGNVTANTATIWLQIPNLVKDEVRSVFVTLHEGAVNAPAAPKIGVINATYDALNVGILEFVGLTANIVYYYKLWEDMAHTKALETNGLSDDDLHFQTLPTNGFDDHLDFLLMSCHNPGTQPKDGAEGFAVWQRIPEIIQKNKNQNVRFAILAGDQIYADEVELRAQKEPDLRKRQELYLGVYKQFWDNVHYRKVLCSLPAYLMWDDHDITDGWGSRVDSFRKDHPEVFEDGWLRLFEAAQSAFEQMQASRNPEPLSKDEVNKSFDFCFNVGRAGFAVPDLRSNRNVRLPRIMLPAQLDAIRTWVNDHKKNFDVLFFVSTVVFSHDAPQVTGFILKTWFLVLGFVGWLKKLRLPNNLRRAFDRNIGDLRDDINDSWGASVNRAEADRVLDFLFELQNPPDPAEAINVVILSGDIHTPGYSTIYSADPKHTRQAVIPHIVATPVAYSPFHWLGEAIFRHLSPTVALGNKKIYTAQVSHHFCYRNVVVVSFRKFPGVQVDKPEMHLKVKYYLEGYPEPQIMLFDLNRSSHREDIGWSDSQPIQSKSN
jgi:phosphodiesterase/alkaline phosphatase D-like protein